MASVLKAPRVVHKKVKRQSKDGDRIPPVTMLPNLAKPKPKTAEEGIIIIWSIDNQESFLARGMSSPASLL